MKCKHYKECEYYDSNGVTCNKDAGIFYSTGVCGKYKVVHKIDKQ